MKRNNIQKIFGWMPVSLLLLFATACSESIIDTANVSDNVPNVVTFTVNTESNTVSTRTGEGEDDVAASTTYHISDGSHADVLKYAVYEVTKENGKETFTLAKEFGKNSTTQIDDVTASEGQTIISTTTYPYKIKLSLNPDKTYKVAFWAQNSKTDAYDTHDLTQVKVKYNDAANNDELRDAFCAISDEITSLTDEKTVTLRRPLAQVNVGTTGWDYEGAAILDPSAIYTKSTITLEGVAQYYDVLERKALDADDLESRKISDDATTDVTFNYARIPAFINVSEESNEWNDAENKYKPFGNEEYLKVKLYEGNEYKPYVSWDEYLEYKAELEENKDEDLTKLPETETFKYLSMCYVLVPEAESLKNDNGTSKHPEADNATFGSVLQKVVFNVQDINEEDASGTETSSKGEVFELNYVPVQKNWRTNILGNNFFTVDQPLKLTIVTDYCGDYTINGQTQGNWITPEIGREEGNTYEIWFSGTDIANNTSNFFQLTTTGQYARDKYGKGKYNGKEFNSGYKVVSSNTFKFEISTDSAYVYIVQGSKIQDSNDSNKLVDCTEKIKLVKDEANDIVLDIEKDDKASEEDENVRVYILELPAGKYELKQAEDKKESGVFYVKVVEFNYIEGENNGIKTPNDNFDDNYGDNYYGNEDDSSSGDSSGQG